MPPPPPTSTSKKFEYLPLCVTLIAVGKFYTNRTANEVKQNGNLWCLSVRDMNPKSKRTKLNSAFKSVQRLPPLLPKTHGRRQIADGAGRQPIPPQAAASFTPPPVAPGLQSLAE